MTVFSYPYAAAGATDGATVTTANSGHSAVSATPPNFVLRDGYMFIHFEAGAGQEWVSTSFTAADTFTYADVIYVDVAASAALEIWYLRDATAKQINILTNTTKLFQLRNDADANVGTITAFTNSVPYIRQIAIRKGTTTTNGQIRYRVTPLAGGTPLIDYTGNAENTGITQFTQAQWGDLTSTPTITMDVGRVQIATGADALDTGSNLKFIDPITTAVIDDGDIYTFPYTNAVDGATVTTTNSAHSQVSPQAPNFVKRAGYNFIHFEAGAVQEWVSAAFTATDVITYADVVYVDVAASAALEIWYLRDATSKQVNILTNTTRLMQMRNDADVNITGAVTSAMTLGVGYMRQIAVRRGTSTTNGQVRYRVTPLAGGAPIVDFTSDAENTGITQFSSIQWGDLTDVPTITMDVGRVAINTGIQALDGPGGNLKFIQPYTAANSVFYTADGITSVPAELWFTANGTTSVRVDVA